MLLLLEVDPEEFVLLDPAEIPAPVKLAFTPFDTVVEFEPEFRLVPTVFVVVIVVVVDCRYIRPFFPSGVLQGSPAPCNVLTIFFASGDCALQHSEEERPIKSK